MSKLSLPPLNGLPPAAQSAFRSIAAWANSMDDQAASFQRNQTDLSRSLVVSRSAMSSVAEEEAKKAAHAVVTRRSDAIVRQVLENSGTLPYIEMKAPVLFQATNTVGVRDYKLFIGAGGIAGGYSPAGTATNTVTFSISTDDGSFFFGAEDPTAADPMHRQIVFDALNNVITFGASIVIQRSSGPDLTLEELAASIYTKDDLTNDLASGVGAIAAGFGLGYGMTVQNNGVYFSKTGAVYNGYSSTADSTNTRLPMVAITAEGLAMGFNDVDGAWKNSIAIEAATGNVTVLGTLKTGSVIEVGSTIGAGGQTVGALQTAATNAQTAAANAQTAANNANAAVTEMASDDKLTPLEKQSVRGTWDILAAEKSGINTQATTFGITTENTTYNSAFQSLANYLNNGVTWVSGIPSWISDANLAATTTIVGATFRATVKAYYDARTALLNAIAAKAKTLADNAQTTANSVAAAVAAKLDASSSYVLSGAVNLTSAGGGIKTGTITWDGSGNVTGGSGVALTAKGLVGASGGVATFSIDTNGNAVFKGDISGATGTFSGNVVTNGYVRANGAYTAADSSTYAIRANETGASQNGVWGFSSTSSCSGVVGYHSGGGSGVFGMATGSGNAVYGVGTGSAKGGYFSALGGAPSLECVTYFKWGAYTFPAPDGSTTKFLRADGTWSAGTVASLSNTGHSYTFANGLTTGAATATFNGATKPGGASTNSWLALVIDGTTYYIPVWS